MTKTDEGRLFASVPAYAALVISIGGLVYQAGFVSSQVNINARDIAELKDANRTSEADRRSFDARLNRIETKMDMALQALGVKSGK